MSEEARITAGNQKRRAPSISRQASLRSLMSIQSRIERCGDLVQEVKALGGKMKRTPVLKPISSGSSEIPPLIIESSGGETEQPSSLIGLKAKNQSRTWQKPPISPLSREGVGIVAERNEQVRGEEKGRWVITEEDVIDIPALTREELVQEIPRERQLIMGSKEILSSWQLLAEELQISTKELEMLAENARSIVDIRMSTYAVQLFKVVVSAVCRKGGVGSLRTNRKRINMEIQKAVKCGELKEDQVEQVKGMEVKEKGMFNMRSGIKYEEDRFRQKEKRDEERKEEKKEEQETGRLTREDRKMRRLRTQLGGLYSSDSEKDETSETSSSDSEQEDRGRRRDRRSKRRESSSRTRSTSSDISPRREKQRRDKEYLQAVRATQAGKYNGDTQRPQILVSWITQMSQYFSLMDLSRRDEVRIAVSYLEEEAATWWTQVPKHRKKQIKSWKGFKNYVLREFLPHDYNLALWRKLDATYQRTSVAEYVARFHEIQRQLFDLPRKVAKTKLLNGLKPNIRGHVLALRPRTQREVVRLARNFDEAFFSRSVMDKNQWGKSEGFQQKGKIFNTQTEATNAQIEMNLITERKNEARQREARKFPGSKEGEKKQFKCFNCGKVGHMARECWSPKKPFNRASVNTTGHQGKEEGSGASTDGEEKKALEGGKEETGVEGKIVAKEGGRLAATTLAIARVVNPPRSAKLTVYWGHVQGHKAEILVDSGASTIFLSEAFIRKYRVRTCKRPIPITIQFAGQTEQVSTRMVPNASLAIGKYEETLTFEIATAAYDVILGKSWLDEHEAEIVTNAHELYFNHKGQKHVIGKEALVGGTQEQREKVHMMEAEGKVVIIGGKELTRLAKREQGHLLSVRILEKTLKPQQQVQVEERYRQPVEKLLEKYKDTFQEAIPITPDEQIHGVYHDIIIEAGSAPSVTPMYRLTMTESKELKEKVEDLLQRGHIRPSSSPYAAGVLFVPKKGGALRICIDYRQLNKVTVKNRHPLPLIDELLEKLQAAQVFSKMDLTDGYHHIPISEKDRQKTAFRTPMGLFEYTVMPFGLANAPATFQRFMNDIFRDMTDECLIVYMDDLLIHSVTPEEHEKHLGRVLQRLQEKKMCVKLSKSKFFQTDVEFLGYIVGRGAIAPDPEKVRAIVEWPSPLPSVTAVRSFLGLAQFYKRFIPNFSEKAAPLTNLTKSANKAFEWTKQEQQTFDDLKASLATLPKVYLPRMEEPFKMRVQTDASGFAVGAVLHQMGYNGEEIPVAYASRKLEQRELGRPVHEKEFIAIHFALTKWRHLLLGREFEVFTDHHSLQFFMTQKRLDARFARMAGFLAQFNLKINYRPGKNNQVPDALSRRHDYDTINAVRAIVKNDLVERWVSKIKQVTYDKEYQDVLRLCGDHHKIRRGRYWFQQSEGEFWIEKDGIWKIVMPKVLVTELLQTAHQGTVGACQGFLKTYAAVRKAFFWGGMFVDVLQHIRKYSCCAQIKDATTAMRGPLCSIPPSEERWQQVSMDFISDLSETENSKDTILTVVDSLTKMGHFIPCKKTDTAREIAILFRKEIWRHHGLPKVTISDRDTRFVCDFWKSMNELLGTQIRMSTAFHPETDGQSERANRTIEQILRYYCTTQQERWDEFVEMAEFAYNNSQHSSTRMTPFLAAYGYNPIMDLPHLYNQRNRTAAEQVEFMNQAKRILQEAISRVQQYQKRQADRKGRRPREFMVGEWVWLNTTNLNMRTLQKKLAPRYVGLMQITKRISEVAYQVRTPERWRIHNVFYVGLLKGYEGDTPEEENKKMPVLTAGYVRRT